MNKPVTRIEEIPTTGNIYLPPLDPQNDGTLNNGEKRLLSEACGMKWQDIQLAFQAASSMPDDAPDEAKIAALGNLDIADWEYGVGRVQLRRISMAADVPANAERTVIVHETVAVDPTPAG